MATSSASKLRSLQACSQVCNSSAAGEQKRGHASAARRCPCFCPHLCTPPAACPATRHLLRQPERRVRSRQRRARCCCLQCGLCNSAGITELRMLALPLTIALPGEVACDAPAAPLAVLHAPHVCNMQGTGRQVGARAGACGSHQSSVPPQRQGQEGTNLGINRMPATNQQLARRIRSVALSGQHSQGVASQPSL